MISSKLGMKTDADCTGEELQSESSQRAIQKLSEPNPLAPAVEPPPAQPGELSPKPPASSAPEKIERFYSDDWRTERWKFFVSSLPMSLVIGLGFYLFITGTSQWFVDAVMLIGFVVFGLAGFLIEQRTLKEFACPRCQAPIEDWDTNETHRILFHCAHCDSSWDIEFKPRPEPELHPSPA